MSKHKDSYKRLIHNIGTDKLGFSICFIEINSDKTYKNDLKSDYSGFYG